jgi:hypothetical protein
MNKNSMNAIIVSRNFNPGHYSHLVANYRLFTENSINTYMFHHPAFNRMGVFGKERVMNHFRELRKLKRIDLAIFWFPSLKNIVDIILLRIFYKTKIVYIFHEPFESIQSYYEAGFSALKTAKIMLVQLINYIIVLMSNKIILPSSRAFAAFERMYQHTNKPHLEIPLLFDDEAVHINNVTCRHYISYIGTIAEDHSFDEFVKMASLAMEHHWFPGYQFLIATKSVVPPRERAVLLPYIKSGMILLEEGRPMSTDIINNHFNNSIVVWNAYRRSMQSGVLPKAYMFGTPLIVSTNNISEYFINHHHGIVVSSEYHVDELRASISDIIQNFNQYSASCRSTFLSTFYHRAHGQSLIQFIHN